jgi:anaerobic selenocysteine-containing dehydrogenase/NADPH-dependent glutamate synthase beta subunit-like oxidoreductase/NAD-dependent dihydropyrimidine dehydrogenase PreA subunit
MAYVVTASCLGDRFTKCVDVCPVDAFREGPQMLYIDPQVCIDCNACLTECPVRAIYPDSAVPEPMQDYIELNARMAKQYPPITESLDVDDSQASMTVKAPRAAGPARRLAVIGAGPSGFYAADEMLRQLPGSSVDIFERLPTPFGLVRYGVAPDHPKIKSVAASFDKIARSPKVRFFGNVELGRDLSRDELLEHYDAVLYATGGSASRPLALPGAELGNIQGASAFVGWYNGHPDYRDLQVDLSGDTALVIGMGNVALDIARILAMPVAELELTDIADYALEALRQSNIREVCLVARRGPVQAAFTPKELRQLLDTQGVDILVEADDLLLDAASAAELAEPLNTEARHNMALLQEALARPRLGDRAIRFVFKASPSGFAGADNHVVAMQGVHNSLQDNGRGSVSAQASDRQFRFNADLVVNATGYQGVAIAGVAFDERRGVIANDNGRVLGDQAVSTKEYAAGWIKRGASGVIGSNKQCAVDSVGRLVADLAAAPTPLAPGQTPDVRTLLEARGIEFVSFSDWTLLDTHEREQGEPLGRPRRKVVEVAHMLEIIRDRRQQADQAQSAAVSSVKSAAESAANEQSASIASVEVKTHLRTCTLCEAMCGIKIEYQGDKILSIAGDPDDQHSRGHICPKGYALQDLHNDPERLRTPLKRVGEQWLPISWDDALDEVAERLADIQASQSNDAVAAYWGNPTSHNMGIMLTMGRFRKALNTRNLFSASTLDQMPHQLVSYLMYGHSQMFTIPDIDRTDYMLMLGANPAASNGSLMSAGDVLGRLQAITGRGGKIVLIDPRRTETALYVSEHQFIQPGTDALFLLGLLQVIIERRLGKPGRLLELAKGWEVLGALLERIPLARIAERTGIAAADIERIAVEYASADKAVCYGRMGVSTQEFGALNHWLINLLNILTGNLDSAGGMMFSTPAVDLLKISGRGGFDRYRSRVRGLPEFIRELPAPVLAEEMLVPGKGQVRAFVSVAGNPVLSSPNGRNLEQALEQLEFMVSVDFYLNETTRHAHIILPPTGPLEHEQYDLIFNLFAVRNVAKYAEPLFPHPPGTRSDWDIFSELSKRIERRKMAHKPLQQRLKYQANARLGEYFTPQRILDQSLRTGAYGNGGGLLSRLNPFARKGLSLAELKKHPHGIDLGPLKPSLPGRLFTKDKKIDLAPARLVADLDRLCQRFAEPAAKPGLLLIGRRDLRTNNSWMHNSYRLVKGKDRCALFLHPEDATAHGLGNRDQARLVSAKGELLVTVKITEDIMPGVVSLPHGWGHHRPGMRISTAQAHPGVSINDITDEQLVDQLSGNAVLNGVPVTLQRHEEV